MELHVRTFADLMQGQPYAEIRCPYSGQVVRKLSVVEGMVQIDALVPPVLSVPLNTPIVYEPWFMDRGSLLFDHADLPGGKGKICTEADVIEFPNGKVFSVKPSVDPTEAVAGQLKRVTPHWSF